MENEQLNKEVAHLTTKDLILEKKNSTYGGYTVAGIFSFRCLQRLSRSPTYTQISLMWRRDNTKKVLASEKPSNSLARLSMSTMSVHCGRP